MGIARKWVFPIIRILIFVVIAGALVKIAFFGDTQPVSDAASPTGEIVEPQVPVTIGTIQNDVTLQGTVAADDAIEIKATLAGQVRKVMVSQGQYVDAGTEILTLRADVANPDGTSYVDYETVVAPTAGVLSSFTALVDQTFAVGDDVGKVAPPTFHVSGPIAPEQQYRLLNQPSEAQVTITGGPAPFSCTGLTIAAPVAGADAGASPGSPTVRCAVPAGVTVFAGLSAELTLAGGVATDVLTIPTTAVEGSSQTGNVYFVLPDGTTESRPVTLGINDGINVEVTGGLAEGDMVLQFIPGAAAIVDGPLPGECIDDGLGNTVCG
ncbi:multidrug efflux pump subunit AcrA (membrane-fusion protein) [Salinibacterium sp. CAN_S4]|uniref:efflux RND transporter periplasmic adaptor subunit n=1 Tax=Salinibacterium sp. CAN_S4 TaxID=2787727 RepID=UPI0018EF9C7E